MHVHFVVDRAFVCVIFLLLFEYINIISEYLCMCLFCYSEVHAKSNIKKKTMNEQKYNNNRCYAFQVYVVAAIIVFFVFFYFYSSRQYCSIFIIYTNTTTLS